MEWPEPVERVAAFLRDTGAEARIEELPTPTATAQAAADAVGCTLGQVVKSIVLMCDASPVVTLVPGDRKVDTGKVARLVGARRATIADPDEVLAATGFRPGAVRRSRSSASPPSSSSGRCSGTARSGRARAPSCTSSRSRHPSSSA